MPRSVGRAVEVVHLDPPSQPGLSQREPFPILEGHRSYEAISGARWGGVPRSRNGSSWISCGRRRCSRHPSRADFDQAIARARQAVKLDPASLLTNRNLTINYLMARRYDDALA